MPIYADSQKGGDIQPCAYKQDEPRQKTQTGGKEMNEYEKNMEPENSPIM